ncbi:serine hydrolase [Winogradskyella litoriviva]|uniref:Serine hydrolase n=1 Tax=Winogradskyella litoriviva TaxID=1220182 RepID=A0ABX2E1K8_9FLAO|nr:serine hydrolase domain-containing protein [Winogradskyella litoriviva]NRD21641.1 serine hydrolase [Winogradskyella litoriviva]
MKLIQFIIISILVFSCNNSKETAEKIEISEDKTFSKLTSLIDGYAKNTLQKGNINSIALAVYKDGETYQNYYGEIENGKKNIPSDSSLYEIASITKTFTGALASKAVLSGVISLDDDIRKYLGDDYKNLEFEGQPITIKHLLTHSLGLESKTTKGLQTYYNQLKNGEENAEYTIQDLLEDLKNVEVVNKPGTKFMYNNIGPEILAYILEKVNKKSFKTQIKDLLSEIGMNNTFLNESEKFKANLVKGNRDGKPAMTDYCPLYGAAGGAISTLPDMAKYMQYLIESKNKPWVNEVSRSLFEDKEDDENIGYLWQNIGVGEEEGYYYSKTGTSKGIQSGLLICPDSDYGIVVIINNVSDAAFNDWANLFFTEIEADLIKYPKLNLASKLKQTFLRNSENAFKEFRELKTDTAKYFINLRSLNNYGYQLLNENKQKKAVDFFMHLTKEYPENANFYDSLGEAYFITEDYNNALNSYKKSLVLDPKNENAKKYINKIEELILEKS